MTSSASHLKLECATIIRFVAFGTAMAIVNVVPYFLSHGAYGTDGVETAGWPFACYEFGGFSPHLSFHPWALVANILIAIVVTGLLTWIFRNGVWNTLRKWQTYGTPWAT